MSHSAFLFHGVAGSLAAKGGRSTFITSGIAKQMAQGISAVTLVEELKQKASSKTDNPYGHPTDNCW